jgi:hypothetical protein
VHLFHFRAFKLRCPNRGGTIPADAAGRRDIGRETAASGRGRDALPGIRATTFGPASSPSSFVTIFDFDSVFDFLGGNLSPGIAWCDLCALTIFGA